MHHVHRHTDISLDHMHRASRARLCDAIVPGVHAVLTLDVGCHVYAYAVLALDVVPPLDVVPALVVVLALTLCLPLMLRASP